MAKWTVLPGSRGCLLASRQSKLDTSVRFCDGDGKKIWQDLCANTDLTLNANLWIKEAPGYAKVGWTVYHSSIWQTFVHQTAFRALSLVWLAALRPGTNSQWGEITFHLWAAAHTPSHLCLPNWLWFSRKEVSNFGVTGFSEVSS